MENELDLTDVANLHKERLQQILEASEIEPITADSAMGMRMSELIMHLKAPELIMEVAGALNVASHEDVPKLLAFMQQLANNMDVVSVEIDARCPARTIKVSQC